MRKYTFSSEELIRLLEETINLFLKYQFQHGFEEPGARVAAIMDTLNGETGCPQLQDSYRWDCDAVYNNLAEILSKGSPIEEPADAFNCAKTLADILVFMKRVTANNELGPDDRRTFSEILGALEVLARRITEYERRVIGIEMLPTSDIMYLKPTSEVEE
ncbi:MAG TPA: hypothetical protein PK250_13280 [Syntrophobacter fumaroxidans]|nr:hypothetical protein [Syntrophobacter fumaroxidans]